jgi:hypothetical protein
MFEDRERGAAQDAARDKQQQTRRRRSPVRRAIQGLRFRRVMRAAHRESCGADVLNLLVAAFPWPALFIDEPHALPENWLRRDRRRFVLMVVIGGWA